MNSATNFDYSIGRAICIYNSSFRQQLNTTDQTETDGANDDSRRTVANPISAYKSVFGEAVPPAIIRQAANRLCLDEMEEALLIQISRGAAVHDWQSFADSFTQPTAADAFASWALPDSAAPARHHGRATQASI